MFKLIQKINMRPKNFNLFLVGVGLFFLFLLLTFLESQRIFVALDPLLTQKLQQIIPRSFDLPLSIFTILGGVEVTTLILLGIFYFLNRSEKITLYSLGLFAMVIVFELTEKFLIFHPGPPKIFFRYALPFSTPAYLTSHFSFPSGHVSRTVFLLVVLAFAANRTLKDRRTRKIAHMSLIVIAILMMISRVYLGEHWTSDVLGGLLLGSAMGSFAMVYY